MMLRIPDVLTKAQVGEFRRVMADAPWVDGNVTSGHQSAKVKDNMQLPEDSPAARRLGDAVLDALAKNPLFMSAALPMKIFPPLFNRYQGGQTFGTHVDNAIRAIRGTPHRVRTDLSATLFLAEPEEYDGGELVVEDTYGTHAVKAAGGPYGALSGHEPAPRRAGDRGGRVSRPSSGSRAWCATTRTAHCSSSSTRPSRISRPTCRRTRAS